MNHNMKTVRINFAGLTYHFSKMAATKFTIKRTKSSLCKFNWHLLNVNVISKNEFHCDDKQYYSKYGILANTKYHPELSKYHREQSSSKSDEMF